MGRDHVVYICVDCFLVFCGCCFCGYVLLFFFFMQKTAYEMRISDWSSDVCSSDLTASRRLWSRGAAATADAARGFGESQIGRSMPDQFEPASLYFIRFHTGPHITCP